MESTAALGIVAIFVTVYLLFGLAAIGVLCVLIRNHNDAKRYRALVREAERLKANKAPSASPTGPVYRMTYKNGKKSLTVDLPGSTEAEALSVAAQRKISWTSITSLDKIS